MAVTCAAGVVLGGVVAFLLAGVGGLVVLLLLLQTVTLLVLAKVRIDLGRETRSGARRLERRVTGLLQGQNARLHALERATQEVLARSRPGAEFALTPHDPPADRGDGTSRYERMLEADPSDMGVRAQLVERLIEDGRDGEARRHAALLPSTDDATYALHPNAVRFDAVRLRCQLGVDPPGPRPLAAEAQRQFDSGDVQHGLELAELGIRRHPESIKVNDLLVSGLDAVGRPDAAFDRAVTNARRRIERLEVRRPSDTVARKLAPEQRVMISGYFYSGSSAVLDHLLGFPGAVKWTPAGEMRLIKFPGGFGELAERQQAAGGLDRQALLDLYLHIVGRKVVGHGSGIYSTWGMVNRNSRRLLGDDRATGYVQACLEGFEQLAEMDSPSSSELLGLTRDTVERALDAAATDANADLLVIDQAVTAWRLELARFLPPSTFIVVHRDPRDQFAEVKDVLAKPGRQRQHARTPAGFAQRYRKDREQADRMIPKLERRHGHRFLRLSFEEFVLDHARCAEEVHATLGLDSHDMGESNFDPAVSSANVGKHRDRLEPSESAELSRLLPEYLSRHADSSAAA